MNVTNLMCFVRQIDERVSHSTERLLDFTKQQMRLIKEYPVDHTFLLQYDAFSDENFVQFFQEEATDRTELGLWYEIVEPLTSACGLPYRSEMGWKWDWHIDPGFSMAYTPAERELLIDEAMQKFRRVFGSYPKTVASWLIDTHTVNYLTEKYDISALAICRDQSNTDAYTLRGGYFSGGYYPSKRNMFTPAQTAEYQGKTPIFRLLGPCPVFNYDGKKYASEETRAIKHLCFTLEPGWYTGSTPTITDWFWRTYYDNESLGFAHTHIGQENSFMIFGEQVLRGMRMQIEQLLARKDVTFQKMADTGETFRARYPRTPATAVTASDTWDSVDLQSVFYDCGAYSANLFRHGDRIFLRSLFLFDERVEERYLRDTCRSFDAVYENLPVIDTLSLPEIEEDGYGLELTDLSQPFTVRKEADGVLRADTGEGSILFYEDHLEIAADTLLLHRPSVTASLSVEENCLNLCYRETVYRLRAENAHLTVGENGDVTFRATADRILLYPEKL